MKICKLFFVLMISNSVFGNVNTKFVELTSIIDGSRKDIKLIGRSSKSYGLICSNIELKVQLENPRLYMQAGEFIERIDNVFFYPKEEERVYSKTYGKKRLSLINEQSEDEIIIKSVSLNLGSMRCYRANFSQYCKYAQKDEFEKFSLTQVGKKLNSLNCESLSYKLNDTFLGMRKILNLNDTSIMDFRFLSYLNSIRSVYVNNTFKDRSGTLERKIKNGELKISILETQRDFPASRDELSSYVEEEEISLSRNFTF